jgi:hypothetical protein
VERLPWCAALRRPQLSLTNSADMLHYSLIRLQIVGIVPPSMTNSVPVIAEALSEQQKQRVLQLPPGFDGDVAGRLGSGRRKRHWRSPGYLIADKAFVIYHLTIDTNMI